MTCRLPLRTLGVAAAALAVTAAPGAFDACSLDRASMLGGDIWRTLTGHLVHATPYHLAWNVVALVILGFLFESTLERRLWVVLGASALAVGWGVPLLSPGLGVYCGLSGVLNGVLVGGALDLARRERAGGHPGRAAVFHGAVVVALGKIAVEAAAGPLFTDEAALGGQAVPLAHALGALGGVAALASAGVKRAAAGPGVRRRVLEAAAP